MISFFKKKSKKKNNIRPRIVWQNETNRIILTKNDKIIIERKIDLESYHVIGEDMWIQENSTKTLIYILGQAYLELLLLSENK